MGGIRRRLVAIPTDLTAWWKPGRQRSFKPSNGFEHSRRPSAEEVCAGASIRKTLGVLNGKKCKF
jgi:hypothetical protein